AFASTENAPTCTAYLPLRAGGGTARGWGCGWGCGAGVTTVGFGAAGCAAGCGTGTTSTLLPLGDTCRRVSTPLCSSITCTLSTVTGAGACCRGTAVGAGTGAGVALGTTSTFGASACPAAVGPA